MTRSENPAPILPGRVLTVVIRDDSPMFFCDDGPQYRSVQIELTDEQRAALALRWVGSRGREDLYETISRAFIEPVEPSPEVKP